MENKRILVIDDEEYVREVVQICLETVAGWEVIAANSGISGIEIAEKEQPDAILLDVMMPEMDGIMTFKKLQLSQLTKNIPIVLLTAKAEVTQDQELAEIGIKATIPKPFEPLELPVQIAKALNWDV
ncbi:response regulator [Mastigocoleus testarum]|uniref:Two-component system response regulator n=1 Tax=Mastigocoleus testarum BC008 TaxID=371196 RepID=A0A0V7ZF66_9CYAN|nr:response regulator [Mastigocoleus testarum]KST63174.1 two-component system response regulator [Mastigocoleus testarum BC008]KST63182.1 two-component system response regulator [Mastigocoleus testarum BC008]